MTLAEFFAQMRALMTNAEAETPEIPAPPPAPVETPDPPADGQQAIVDAVLAALAAQQQTTPPPAEPPPTETPPAAPATPPAPARQSAGPPANPGPTAPTLAQIDAWPAARILENKDAVLAALERERPGDGLARFVEGGNA